MAKKRKDTAKGQDRRLEPTSGLRRYFLQYKEYSNNQLEALGFGEYERVGENGERVSVQEMRKYLLRIVSLMVPAFTEFMEKDLLGLYQKIPLMCYEADETRKRGQRGRSEWRRIFRPSWDFLEAAWKQRAPGVPFELDVRNLYATTELDSNSRRSLLDAHSNINWTRDPKIHIFLESMFEWSKHYHLDIVWCRHLAYETLDLWCQCPYYRSIRYWTYTEGLPPSYLPQPPEPLYFQNRFIFEAETDYPVIGFFDEVKKRIMKDCERQIVAFLKSREDDAQGYGLRKTIIKRELSHFEWVAKYQVIGASFKEISGVPENQRGTGKNCSLPEDTSKVRKAVNELARLIDLPLRPEGRRPGRPRKRNSSAA
jgi:hypothetical protein